MKKTWIILRVLILSLLISFPAGATDSTAFNPVPIPITATAVSLPVGSVMPWPANNLPPLEGGTQKWAECNGASLLQTAYPELFAEIGATYGGGGVSFKLPDLRGEFIRGLDHGKGVDVGRTIGTTQAQSTSAGGLRLHVWWGGTYAEHSSSFNYGNHDWSVAGQGFASNNIEHNSAGAKMITSTASETRPRNIAMMYLIRISP